MSDLKPCPVCKGQSGGIGSDGVENDCMACFTRDVQAASPRVEACIASCLARYHGESKAAQARYFEEVHQHLAPLARSLEIELAEAKAELARRTQPEATAPAQDLGAAITAKQCLELETIGAEWMSESGREVLADWIEKQTASSANALSAGDRVDAERLDFMAQQSNKTVSGYEINEMPFGDGTSAWFFFDRKTQIASKLYGTSREAIDAAILQSQKGDGDA